jgi:ATP phosphoribosyltransferase regulatory subunit
MITKGANRLCYAGNVVHTKPKNPLATRTPMQVGLEFYGEAGIAADIEVISLLLESLRASGLAKLHLDLGHVGIYRALAACAKLDPTQEDEFFDLLQRKAVTEIRAWVAAKVSDPKCAELLLILPSLAGGADILGKARELFSNIPDAVAAVDQLLQVAGVMAVRYPDAEFYFDLSELRGYHYLTGLVFAAFAPGFGNPIASGGRYDHIGEVFGRARPATGFALDICAISKLGFLPKVNNCTIAVVDDGSEQQWQQVQALRLAGERVVFCAAGTLNTKRELRLVDDNYQVVIL